MSKRRICLAAALVAALAAPNVFAHGGANHSIEEFTEEIEEHPASAKLRLLRADELRIADQHDAALRDAASARKLGAVAEASVLEGRILLDAGRPTEAVAALDEHLRIRPRSVLGLWYRARARRQLGQTQRAAADYTRAVRLGGSVDIFAERGEFLEENGDIADAADNYRDALARFDNVVLRESLWRVELLLGHPKRAIAAIDPVLENASLKTRWLLHRAIAHEAGGDLAAAKSDRAQAMKEANAALAKRRSPVLLIERSRAHQALGNRAAALADAEEAARRAPHYEPAVTRYDQLLRASQ